MQPDSEVIDHLVRSIVEAVHPLKIVLFGSAVRGEMDTNSDIDVLVVMPERYDADIALESIRPAKKRLVEKYGKYGADLPEAARRIWHTAKANVEIVELLIAGNSPNESPGNPLATTEQLSRIRVSLTDLQMALIAARQSIRDIRAQRILEVI